MAKFRFQKNSLIGGEISGTALGRTDLPSYAHSCETLQNMIPMLSGGAYRRPGTFLHEELDENAFLIPFIAADEEEFVISIGTDEIKAFHVPQLGVMTGVIVNGGNPSPFTSLLNKTRYVQSGDTLFIVNPYFKPIIMQWNGSQFTVGEFDSTVTGGGTSEIRQLERDAWPYLKVNTNTGYSITPVAAYTGYGTIGTFTIINGMLPLFDVGTVVKVYDTNGGPTNPLSYASFKVTELTNATTIKGSIITDFNTNNLQSQFWLSAWDNARGWPGTIEFYAGRLVYAGTATYADSLWFSESNDYFQLSKINILDPENGNSVGGNPSDIVPSDPFTVTFATGRKSRITWLKSAKDLFVGTRLGEHQLTKVSAGDPFWVETAVQYKQSDYGSTGVIAYDGSNIFFVSPEGDKIRSLSFNWQEQAYIADEIQVMFDDFPTPDNMYSGGGDAVGIQQLVWDGYRSTLWAISSSGELVGCTFHKKLGVAAWHTHRLAKDFIVNSIATVRSDITDDVAGASIILVTEYNSQFFLESFSLKYPLMDSVYDIANAYALPNYLDHSTTSYWAAVNTGGGYDGRDPSTWTLPIDLDDKCISAWQPPYGLTSLGVYDDVTNANFHWTGLPDYSIPGTYLRAFTVGYQYDSIVKPVRIEAGSQVGTSQGAMKRIHKFFIRFFRTMYAQAGSDANRLEEIQFRTGSTPMGNSAEFFSGDKEVLPTSDFDRDGYVYIKTSEPVPMTVLSIASEGQTYD